MIKEGDKVNYKEGDWEGVGKYKKHLGVLGWEVIVFYKDAIAVRGFHLVAYPKETIINGIKEYIGDCNERRTEKTQSL